MNIYNNSKIYKVIDVGYNKTYIGSTCQPLCKRFSKHKEKYNQYLNGKQDSDRRVNLIFDEYGIDNCKIELIETYPCDNRMELLKREGEHIRSNDCVNKIISGRTLHEYREDDKEHIKHQKKQYREDNKEYVLQQKQVYRELHPDIIKKNSEEYYEKNKEKLNERKLCNCGKYYTAHHIRRHEKSQHHQKYLKQLEEEK